MFTEPTYQGAEASAEREMAQWLRPCGGAGYRAPFCRLERFRKAASFGESLRNVAVERRVAAEFIADAGLRVEDKHWNLDSVTDNLH